MRRAIPKMPPSIPGMPPGGIAEDIKKRHNRGYHTKQYMTLRNLIAPKQGVLYTMYPTGEFSATPIKNSKVNPAIPSPGTPSIDTPSWTETSYAQGQVSAALRADLVRSTLGLSKVANSHKPRTQRGQGGITRYQQRLVRNSCLLLERSVSRSLLSFLTLTLPPEFLGLSRDQYAHAKKLMLQKVRRGLVKGGVNPRVVGVTEVQEQRFNNLGQFALHEHWVFQGRLTKGAWIFTPQQLTSMWIGCLEDASGIAIPPNRDSACVNVQRVRKSCAAYLGKYLSKGVSIVSQAIEKGFAECLPSSWVTRTIEMLQDYKRSIVKFSETPGYGLMDCLRAGVSTYARWSKSIHMEGGDGNPIWLAWVAFLTPKGMEAVRTWHSIGQTP